MAYCWDCTKWENAFSYRFRFQTVGTFQGWMAPQNKSLTLKWDARCWDCVKCWEGRGAFCNSIFCFSFRVSTSPGWCSRLTLIHKFIPTWDACCFLHCRIVSEFSVGTFEGWLAARDKRCIKEALFKTPFIRSKQASSFYLNRQTPFIRSRQPALLKDRRCMQEAFIQRWNKERSRNSGDGEWTVGHITWSNSLSNVGWMHGGLTDNKCTKSQDKL